MQNLGKLLDLLLTAHIDFVLVGGFASVIHGSSMVTHDLDICILLDPEHIETLRQCLKPYHPTHRMTPQRLSFLEFPKDISNIKNLYLETDLGILDIINHIDGVGSFERVRQDAIEIEIYGKNCKVISIDDLIACKKAIRRPKDLAVARELEALKALPH